MSRRMITGPRDVGPEDTGPGRDGDAEEGNRTSGAEAGGSHGPQQSRKQPIPSLEDCMRLMTQLIGMVTIGIMKPAQANSIRSMLRDLMEYHQGKTKRTEQGLSNTDVLELLKNHPTVLNLLEPFLTQEQIDMIMKSGGDAANGGA
jgi:hypothetical protein